MDPPKKKPGALAALLAGGGDHAEPDADDEDMGLGDEEEGGHDAAFSAFAHAAGIKATPEAKDALKEFVQACMQEYGPEKE